MVTGMRTMISRLGCCKTRHRPASSFSFSAARLKRAACCSQGLLSCSRVCAVAIDFSELLRASCGSIRWTLLQTCASSIGGQTFKVYAGECSARKADATPALTLLSHEFILDVCLKNVPARLYLPAFPVRSLACQTRFRPERRAILGVFLGGGCHADSGSGTETPQFGVRRKVSARRHRISSRLPADWPLAQRRPCRADCGASRPPSERGRYSPGGQGGGAPVVQLCALPGAGGRG